MHEVVRVPKLQWRCQEDVMLTSSGQRAAGGKQQSHRGEAAHTSWSSHHRPGNLNGEHGAIGFNVCPSGFESCFSAIPPFCSPIPPFGMGIFTLCHCVLEVWNLFLTSQRFTAKSCLESQRI
jgi:hypothetical protein